MNCILLLMIKISIKHLLFRMWTIRAEGYYILKEKRGINIFWDEDFIESNKVVKAVPTDLKRRRFVDDDHHPSMTHRNHCERKRVFDTNKTYDLQKKYGLRLPCSCAFYYYYLNLEVKITFFLQEIVVVHIKRTSANSIESEVTSVVDYKKHLIKRMKHMVLLGKYDFSKVNLSS